MTLWEARADWLARAVTHASFKAENREEITTEKKRIHNTPEAERPPTGSKCASDRIERAKPPPLPQPLTDYFRDRQNEQVTSGDLQLGPN